VKHGAFTLIEMALVILILAIAAAAVGLRVQSTLRGARTGDVLGAVGSFDKNLRAAARNLDRPLRLVVNLSEGTLAQADEDGRVIPGPGLSLPPEIRFARLLVRQQDCSSGEVTIRCSPQGFTPTYALLLAVPGRTQWLVVAGLTGEVIQAANDKEAQDIVAPAGGNNAR
jgi:prepilin-type N-terminal cleavage/methylation domain-containing protein